MSSRHGDRRGALKQLGAFVAGSVARAQDGATQPRRRPPREELINALEYEEVAKTVLPPPAYAAIAGSDRAAFDRITLRPRMCIPTLDLDLSVDLLGDTHFTPIVVGPVADQSRYHRDAERATISGASAAKTTVIVSSRSSVSIRELATVATTPLWYSVYATGDAETRQQIQQAVAAGCNVVCITIGASPDGTRTTAPPRADWNAIDQLRKDLSVPVVIKGVLSAQDAQTAVAQGARGVIVSDHGVVRRAAAPIEVLASITDAVGGKAAVLVDGSFRRGSDILKALILGAHGVLVARPIMWGLATYGAAGVQGVIEMLQSDLARQIGALGASNLKALTRDHLRIHRR